MRPHVKSRDETFGSGDRRLENGEVNYAAVGVSVSSDEMEKFLQGPQYTAKRLVCSR